MSQKTIRDVELIRSDSNVFGVAWRRMQTHPPLDLLDNDIGHEEEEEVAENQGSGQAEEATKKKTGAKTPPGPKKIIPPATVVFYKVSGD